jgi:hypothetical protein
MNSKPAPYRISPEPLNKTKVQGYTAWVRGNVLQGA